MASHGAGAARATERRSVRRVIGRSRKGRTLCSAFEDTGELQDSSSQSSDDGCVTVISGKFHIRMGNKIDEKKEVELRAGGFGAAPAHMNHYAWASEDTVVQVHGQGPFAITYVDPADDPSK